MEAQTNDRYIVPSDKAIDNAIEDCELWVQFLKHMKRLNNAGRAEAMIALFKLSITKEYIER